MLRPGTGVLRCLSQRLWEYRLRKPGLALLVARGLSRVQLGAPFRASGTVGIVPHPRPPGAR